MHSLDSLSIEILDRLSIEIIAIDSLSLSLSFRASLYRESVWRGVRVSVVRVALESLYT